MKKSLMALATWGAATVAAGAADSYYHAFATNGSVFSVATARQTSYPSGVAEPVFWLDCSQTNGWEFSDGEVTKVTSRVGDRYLTATGTRPFTKFNGNVMNKPLWTEDAAVGGVLDFGSQGSGRGMFFNPWTPADAPEGCLASNILKNIRTVISVIDTSGGGGFFLGGGGGEVGKTGFGWHRGGSPDDPSDPLLYSHALFNSHAFEYARRSRYWIDGVPNDPQYAGFSGGWAVTALEPEPGTTLPFGDAWGLGINDARGSGVKRSGGFKVAELLIYDTILSRAETEAVCAYLNGKWLKRERRGRDGRAGLAWLSAQVDGHLTDVSTEIEVAAGDTLVTDVIQGGRAVPGTTPRIVKTGPGAITFPNAANYNGVVELKEGSIRFETPETAATTFPAGLVAHFDTSVDGTLETVLENGTNFVTRWTSVEAGAYRGQTYSLVPVSATRRPFLAANSPFGDGRPVVDFGAYKIDNGRCFIPSIDGATKTSLYASTLIAVVDRRPGNLANIANNSFAGALAAYGSVRTSWFGDGYELVGGGSLSVSQTDGPSYVNGVRHDPTNGVYHGGYSVVAKVAPVNRYPVDRVGAPLSAASISTAGGGFRMVEALFFNRHLTDREVHDISDRLSVKWFGRHADAYRTGSRGYPDIQKLRVAGDEVVVNVEAGAVARIGTVSFVGGNRLVKDGDGTLEVESFAEGAPVEDLVVVRRGKVSVVGMPDMGDEIAVPAAGPSLHLDATDTNRMTFVDRGGERCISKWYDENFRDAAFQANTERLPFLNEENTQNGHPVVDFGGFGADEGRFLSFGRSYESVRAAYVVWMQTTETGYPSVLCASWSNDDAKNNGFFDFARNSTAPGGIYFDTTHAACKMVANGDLYTNGVKAAVSTCCPPMNEFRLVEIHTTGGAHVSGLGGDRSGNPSFNKSLGGCRIGEVLLYERELSEREKVATRNYLMRKWFGVEPDPSDFPEKPAVEDFGGVGELSAPAGETNAVDVAESFSAGRITGAGTLVKEGAGTLTVADVSDFGGTLSVEDGVLALTGAPPDESAALVADGRILHMDASEGLSTATNETGAITVESWRSLLDDGWEAVPFGSGKSAPVPPEVFARSLAGRDIVEMRSGKKQALRLRKDGVYATLGNIHSVFWVIGSQEGGGWLLGGGTNAINGTLYTFHRGGGGGRNAAEVSDGLLNSSHSYEPLRKQASWYLNGGKVANPALTGLSGGWDILSMTIPAATEDKYNYVNIGGFAHDGRCYAQGGSYDATMGNQRLAEVVIYDRELSAAERTENERYLRRKWRLGVRGAVENDATLVLGADATLDCGGVSQYFAAVAGTGTVSNGTFEVGRIIVDAAVGDVLDVQGAFAVPAGLVVEVRNLPAAGAAVPVLRAASLDGRENLASATVVGEDGASLPGGYRLFFRRGVLLAAIPAGFQVIVR